MKTFKYNIVFLLFIVLFHQGFSQDMPEKYLTTAAENNPGIKALFNEYMAALEKAEQKRFLPDPQIAFAFFIQPVETKNGPQNMKFSAMQMFPWFGTLKAEENSMIRLAKAKYELFEEAKSKLFYEVRCKYYELYYLKMAIDNSQENMKILQTLKQLTQVKTQTGKTGSVDILRIEMEIEELKETIISLQDKFKASVIEFNLLINVPVSSFVKVKDLSLIQDTAIIKQQLIDSVLLNNHQITGIDHQIEAITFKKNAVKKSNYPSFSLGIDYISIGNSGPDVPLSGKDAIVFPKIGVTIPIYGKKNRAEQKEIKLIQEAKMFEKENKEHVLKSRVENVWFEFNKSKREIELYEKQRITAQKALDLIKTEFETDSENFEEVLRMQRKYLEYSLKLYKSKRKLLETIAKINYLSGK